MHRGIECFLYRPPAINAFRQCFIGDISLPRPLRECQRFAVECITRGFRGRARGALVVILLRISGPTAIFRRVRAVVIYAINAIARPWTWPHILVKSLKRFTPALTDGYAPPPPFCVIFVSGDITAHFHANPRSVFWRMGHAVRAPLASGLSQHFLAQATTAFSIPLAQGINIYNYNIATIALAVPIDFSGMAIRGTFGLFNHDQATETLTGAILKLIGVFCGIIEGHSDLLSRCVKPWGVSAPPGHSVAVTSLYHRREVSDTWH